jgi:hypothetical protein
VCSKEKNVSKIRVPGENGGNGARAMVKTQSSIFFLALALSLGACVTQSKYADEPLYASGYSDGCASASRGTGRVIPSRIDRDEELYKSDKAYRAGWNAGYRACGEPVEDSLGGGRDWP